MMIVSLHTVSMVTCVNKTLVPRLHVLIKLWSPWLHVLMRIWSPWLHVIWVTYVCQGTLTTLPCLSPNTWKKWTDD